jgi:hypothetical protein
LLGRLDSQVDIDRRLGGRILDRVIEQIVEQLAEMGFVAQHVDFG